MENDQRPLFGIFTEVFPPMMDGVSLTAKNYADWLCKKNHNVCVVTPDVPSYHDHEPYPIFRYFSAPIPMRKPYRIGMPWSDPSFYAKIHKLPFSLLHTHAPFSSGKVALKLAKERKIPLVATFHSKFRSDFERIIPSKTIVDMIIKDIVSFYEQADEVWVPQASVEEPLREYGYKGKVEIVDNGNDFANGEPVEPLRSGAREKLGLPAGEFMFLFVGQHIWEKNVRLIIESLALLKGVPFKMYFIGTGYAEAKMKEMVEELNLSGKVVFTGVIKDRNLLKEYYAAADLFLFPSLYDNAPLVVREAAALHTPSVLLANSTASEIIVPDVNGFLSENSPETYAATLTRIVENPTLLQAVGEKASQTIARSWENIMDEVLERYARLIANYK